MVRTVVAVAFLVFAGQASRRPNLPATHDVDIVAHDYSFAAPNEIPAGQTTFKFINDGKVIHELDIALMREGATAAAVMSAVNARTPLKPLIESAVGIVIARPGRRSPAGLSADLLANRNYLIICRLPDSASGTMHSRMGMIAVVHVTRSRVTARPLTRLDTIFGADYAFRAPLTLSPGSHTLTFVNTGKVLHEGNVALLRIGVTAEQVVSTLKAHGNPEGLIDEWLGVLFAKPGASTLGWLQVVLLPGREYLLTCQLADDDTAPEHLALGMYRSVRTTKATTTKNE